MTLLISVGLGIACKYCYDSFQMSRMTCNRPSFRHEYEIMTVMTGTLSITMFVLFVLTIYPKG